jgi:DNA-directed RNA polymerase specialized sigma24 family protein
MCAASLGSRNFGRMRAPDDFDAFYKDARERLLLQSYALTGDLPAARSAVRDAFIVAWHHWRKVSRLEDPETYVRPQAWAHAQRRHTARVWHRDKSLDPDVRATLDALGKLTVTQRKVLLLTALTTGSLADIAREVGLPRDAAERELQSATSRYSLLRDIPSTAARESLDPLRAQVTDARWPRSTIVRRAGAARRRTHTSLGVLGSVAALVVSGFLVTQGGPGDQVRPTLTDPAQQEALATPSPVSAPSAELSADDLLGADQLARLAPKREWAEGRTTEFTAADADGGGTFAPCRQGRFADPEGGQGLIRRFETEPEKKQPDLDALQISELSLSETAAKQAFKASASWYAGCMDRRMQLLSTAQLARVGDQADLFVLRSWKAPVTTLVVGLARTGHVVTTTVSRSTGVDSIDREAPAALLAAAVNALCGSPGTATCAGPPQVSDVAPLAVGDAPGMISEVDLPPVTVVSKPWVGTQVRKAVANYAASGCARARFAVDDMSNALTRSFVIPNATLPPEFGITQTAGTLPARRAREWIGKVRDQIANCVEKRLGTSVTRVENRSSQAEDITVWHLTTEITDQRSVHYLMAVMRNGTAVSQLGFIPTQKVQMRPGAFLALAERALDRLRRMPEPGAGGI